MTSASSFSLSKYWLSVSGSEASPVLHAVSVNETNRLDLVLLICVFLSVVVISISLRGLQNSLEGADDKWVLLLAILNPEGGEACEEGRQQHISYQ
jgi:hypothetical protein